MPIRVEKYAELAAESPEQDFPSREVGATVQRGVAVREPIGVVACITPSNFPMTNCAGKIGPALACGNTVVVKPAPVDPLGVAELCRIVADVLPPGVISFVNGSGSVSSLGSPAASGSSDTTQSTPVSSTVAA